MTNLLHLGLNKMHLMDRNHTIAQCSVMQCLCTEAETSAEDAAEGATPARVSGGGRSPHPGAGCHRCGPIAKPWDGRKAGG
ncbi:hypothetical protein AVEN_176579-1 [Araneus ventricosus]|uniref:Uncharacterized protein n=1 Tax=Araneus ventricosus TaxID=182803 RepID=A0A4Y2TMD9_ARAVE|nr:hypothetical protein AVEN_176579-1 [Araneus ventricosus]